MFDNIKIKTKTRFRRALLFPLFAVLLSALGISCEPEENAGPRIRPHLSPISFGDIKLRPSGTPPDPSSSTYVPFEWTIFIQAVGTDPVKIEEVCLVGDNHNGNPGDNAFSFEGPDVLEIQAQREAAIRLTYDHSQINQDLNEDGESDPDQVALIIQSNAIDFPTLVVPICGRIIASNHDVKTVECESPVTAPQEGEAKRDLCLIEPEQD